MSEQYLDRSEWFFDDIPPEEKTACFFWEYCREDPQLRILPHVHRGMPEVIDLRNIFLQGSGCYRELTLANNPPAWQKVSVKARRQISRRFGIFFQPVERLPAEDARLPENSPYNTFLEDQRYSKNAINEARQKLDRLPKEADENYVTADENMRRIDPHAPGEMIALIALGMRRCRLRGGKAGEKCTVKFVASFYTKRAKPSQVSREIARADRILNWLRTGDSKYLKQWR